MEHLARFFVHEGREAEFAAARVRRVLIPLFAVRLLAIGWSSMMAGEPKHWVSLGVLGIGLMVSEAMAASLRGATDGLRRLQFASVSLDVAIATAVCAIGIAFPKEGYVGFFARVDWGIFPILAAASGLRLSPQVARVGAAASLAGMGFLGALDVFLNAERLIYGAGDVGLAVVMVAGAALLGDAVAERALRLVRTGAEQAVANERARQRLGAYLSEEVAQLALLDGAAELGGEEREVAVLFSDLRGFTTYSETVAPEALVSELNDYLEALVPAIGAEGGVVDKYIGDAIMAVFGAPRSRGDEACRAIRAAVAMERALALHNEDRVRRGLGPLAQGLGVHWGRVVAGNVGTTQRVQYTVVGDAVNVASRLEGATKAEGVSLLLSEALVARARSEGGAIPELEEHGRIAVRGRSGDLRVYRVAPSPSPGVSGREEAS